MCDALRDPLSCLGCREVRGSSKEGPVEVEGCLFGGIRCHGGCLLELLKSGANGIKVGFCDASCFEK